MSDAPAAVGTCLTCAYDLRGLSSHVCPECGRPFDSEIPATMEPIDGTPLKPVYRFATAKVGWPMWFITTIWFAAIVWYARYPACVRGEFPTYRFLFPLLFWIWGCRLIVQLFLKTCSRDREYRRRIRLIPATAVSMATIALAIIVRGEVISGLAMAISRPALLRIGNRLKDEKDPAHAKHWAGIYRIEGGQVNADLGIIALFSADADATFQNNNGHCEWNSGHVAWVSINAAE
ncbi:MAG TPA: hypothetical protein VFE47_01730 [Tepidisphaeraceae bacterium]|jgi:hypothetical protein|nr:hypothetical protein [Tepidisphaeraceae bacterium]